MRKTNLLVFGIAALFAGCSKKELAPTAFNGHSAYNAATSRQVTWAQGDAIINGTYNIFIPGNSRALEIANGKTGLSIFTNHNQQRWNITTAGDGYFKIQNAGTGKALSIKASSSELSQSVFSGADEQLWKIQHQKMDLYSIVNKASAMAITINSDANGNTKTLQSTYTGANKQLMAVTLVDYALATDSVTIDFSNLSDDMKHVAAGFLHGFSNTGFPPDSLVLPLKINTVRDWIFGYPALGQRFSNLGYTEQLVVSDGFAQPYNSNGPPGNNGDWTSWDNTVTGAINTAQKSMPNNKLQFDIWNEPNGGGFWNFTGQYAFPGWFFETWKHAYQKLHSINPDVVTVGPSYSSFDIVNLKAFLVYCKANNCVPNYLSWHFPTDPVGQVAQMKQFMADSAIYVDGFIINEYTLAAQQTAGKNAYLIGQLERAKVSAAMHAIWGATESGQLDGVVTPISNGNQKLATWWVYKAYGDIEGKIVSTVPSANIELVAGYNPHKELNVLLGCRAKAGEGVIKVKFINVTPGLSDNITTVHFKMQRIPDALNVGAVTTSIPTVNDLDVNIATGNNIQLLINWDSEYDAYTFKVSKALNPPPAQP